MAGPIAAEFVRVAAKKVLKGRVKNKVGRQLLDDPIKLILGSLMGFITVIISIVLMVAAMVVVPTSQEQPADVGGDPTAILDIPAPAVSAYRKAASQADQFNKTCKIQPAVVAAIGYVETKHATYSANGEIPTIDPDSGDVTPQIIGIPLDGRAGTIVQFDTDNGVLDRDEQYDRAVGPMQFIPTSWEIYGVDGNNDQKKDPHNMYDATLAAVKHLCLHNPDAADLTNEDNLAAAIRGYNRNSQYVQAVLQRAEEYQSLNTTSSDCEEPMVIAGTVCVHPSIAANVAGLLTAAAVDGIALDGWGWRPSQRQIELRVQNCAANPKAPTQYEIYDKPSRTCSPPTATPGNSMHERGLAIDFHINGQTVSSQGAPAFRWLAANAGRYGLYNLHTEPWHWSTNGK